MNEKIDTNEYLINLIIIYFILKLLMLIQENHINFSLIQNINWKNG